MSQPHETVGRPPDILYVITDLEIGGVPLHLRRLAVAMRDRGHQVKVVSLKPLGPIAADLEAAGIATASCKGRGGWDLRVINRLATILRNERPRLVHSLLFHANLAARLAAIQADYPAGRLLCEIQTVELERRWHLRVDRWVHSYCRCTIGNSASVIEHLAREARIPSSRLRLVRGGIDPAPIRAATPMPKAQVCGGMTQSASLVLWVGRLDPVKGLGFLLKAFREVGGAANARLALVGGGPLKNSLEAEIRSLELIDRVYLLGSRRDVPRLLATCDLFVFPSRTEGLPNALLEAMAAGRPIVATDVPGNRDLIVHERTGLLVPFGDPRKLADGIIRLLSDRDFATQLGANAAEAVEREWNISKTLDEYEALYREVLERA